MRESVYIVELAGLPLLEYSRNWQSLPAVAACLGRRSTVTRPPWRVVSADRCNMLRLLAASRCILDASSRNVPSTSLIVRTHETGLIQSFTSVCSSPEFCQPMINLEDIESGPWETV